MPPESEASRKTTNYEGCQHCVTRTRSKHSWFSEIHSHPAQRFCELVQGFPHKEKDDSFLGPITGQTMGALSIYQAMKFL